MPTLPDLPVVSPLSPLSPQPRGSFLRRLTALNARILALFVTTPSSGASLEYVDGFRALAAVSVVLLHTWSEAPEATVMLPIPFTGTSLDFTPLLKAGGIGVYLFFVLSGFLLAQPWIAADYAGKPRQSLRHYAVLRLTRIMPAYYFALFVVLIFFTPSLVPMAQVYSPVGLFNVLAHVLFL